MRDMAVLAALLFIIPLVLRNTFAAFIIWGWTVAINLNYYLYGFLQSIRYNLLFALITLTLLVFGRLKWRQTWPFNMTTVLMLWFCVHVSLSAMFAYSPNPLNSEYWLFFVKGMAYWLLIPFMLSTRLRFHAFAIMFAVGLAFHGMLDGLKLIASGGHHNVTGLPGSMMGDNNHLAVALAMVLPVLFYLFQYSKNKLVSLGFISCFILTIIALVATRSRGGFIALVVVGIWMIMTSRRKLLSILLAVIAGILVLSLAPPEWFGRMETIGRAGEDGSFMGRVIAWKISSAIALDNPIFGGGFHAVQVPAVWNAFRFSEGLLGFVSTPLARIVPQAAHSIYFEVLGDHGILGLLLFVGILFSSIGNCFRIRRLVGDRTELIWARDLSDLLGVAVVAYAVGGAAVNLGYFELYYMLVMAIVALRHYVEKQMQQSVIK